MFDFIFGKNSAADNVLDAELVELVELIKDHVSESGQYLHRRSRLQLGACKAYGQLKKRSDRDKAAIVIHLAKSANAQKRKSKNYSDQASKDYAFYSSLLETLLRTRIDFEEDFSFYTLYVLLIEAARVDNNVLQLDDSSFGALVYQIEKQVKNRGLTDKLKTDIEEILSSEPVQRYVGENKSDIYGAAEVIKTVAKLQTILFENNEENKGRMPAFNFSNDRLGIILRDSITALPNDEYQNWNNLFHHLATATGGKPSKKLLDEARSQIDKLGSVAFKQMVNKWLLQAANLEVLKTTETYTHNNREYSYNKYEFIQQQLHNPLKGLLWCMSRFHDSESLANIAKFVEKCFQKVPEQGPAAAAVGNAGIYCLANSKGLDGVSHLSRLKLRIRQNNTQKLIQSYIDEQAKKQGIKPSQIEELAVQDFGLTDGERTESFDDYQLVIKIVSVGKTELQWYKPDGTAQKAAPALVKNNPAHAKKLKKLRDIAKQITQSTTVQRDRIDRLYTENLSWDIDSFDKYYLKHGLVSQIAKKLIWLIDGQAALHVNNAWQNVSGDSVKTTDETTIRLWHPIDSDSDEVLAWRDRLDEFSIQQPLKQAYREIYLLTDAELATRIYSNRMAAHILKQHQFNSLAALRGWKYSLLGAYDDGRDGEIAKKQLAEFKLTAQFWINEIIDDTDSFNDAGIWYYVATDQVRFTNEDDEPVPLVDITPLIFSEIMRDVDLFVGVASVGNDPQWQDGGPDTRADYRAYWQSYSFGDLTEVAKTRKTVLERLLPRLKIRKVSKIDGKFLIVQGKKNTYKIHIGSGNILIAPNDRYLCIVPGRGKDKNVEQVFLPFEGDRGLSIVLSKAFLLADDDKITDQTILSQL